MSSFKSGDWYCRNCNDHQFAKNTKCRMCGNPRPSNISSPVKPVAIMRPGDWLCSVCSNHQFASRTECRDCGASKNSNQSENKQEKKENKEKYLVIDFEANCSSEHDRDHEIIEFPAVLIDTKSGNTISEFHSYIQMVTHKKLSEFIKNLTHITDEQVKNGLPWKECLGEFEQWCRKNNITSKNTTVVTCGDWDIQSMLERQLSITKTRLSLYLTELFSCWNNVKQSFTQCTKEQAFGGMEKMLKYFNLQLEGHHHSGIDDSRNIAKICHELTKRGYDITTPTTFRNSKGKN